MTSLTLYQSAAAVLGVLFLLYGLDIRSKPGAQDLVSRPWQILVKLCALVLVVGFAWLVASMHRPGAIDWLGLVLGTSGTAFVVAAKRALGDAHSFTGQYQPRSRLVTRGVYAITRNPLYFGVFQCELWLLLVALHQLPALRPQDYGLWLCLIGVALAYAVSFNGRMALCEARRLEERFGDGYRRYRSRVPFLVPLLGATGVDTAMPTVGGQSPHRRPFRLAPCEDLDAIGTWFADEPLATQFLNAYTLLIPEGESFIIRSCRRYLGHADDQLREDLQGLFFQEASHSREHGRLLAAMRRDGLGLDTFRRLMDGIYYRLVEPLSPPRLRLATAAAIEHHNAVIATAFLRRMLLQGAVSGEMRRLFIWHFAEELEHQEVVFNLLQRVSRSRLLRMLGLMGSWTTFLFYLLLGTLAFGVRTKSALASGFWRELLAQSFGRQGFLSVMAQESVRYMAADFRPSVAESRALLDPALAELERLGMARPQTG